MSKEKIDADVEFIRALAKLLQDSDLAEIEVEREYGEDDELKVRLSRQSSLAPVYAPAPVAAPAQAQHAPAPLAAALAPAPAASDDPASHPGCLTSPMVGTVYMAAEPGADPFVTVGSAVTAGQTVIIIEAMKTMNQIAAHKSGTVTRIIAENGQPAEYGSPLLIIE